MVLRGLQVSACEPDPLSRQDLHARRTVKLDPYNITRKQLSLQNVQLHVSKDPRIREYSPMKLQFNQPSSESDNLVDDVNKSRTDELHPEVWSRGDSSQSVKNGEEVEDDIQLVSQPEKVESLLSDLGVGKDEHEGNDNVEEDSGEAGESLEQPEGNVGLLVTAKVELFAEAEKMLHWLSAHVVEVDKMAWKSSII